MMQRASELFYVIKNDGSKEPFDIKKIEKVINICSEDLSIDLEKFIKKFH